MAETPLNFSATAMALLKADLGFFDSEIPESMATYLQSLLTKALSDFREMKIFLVYILVINNRDQNLLAI